MDIVLKVFLSFAIVYGVYMLALALLSFFGERELKKAGVNMNGNDEIEIPAGDDSLEYLVRCALFATSFERRDIVIIVSDEDGDDAVKTAQRLSAKNKCVSYRRGTWTGNNQGKTL